MGPKINLCLLLALCVAGCACADAAAPHRSLGYLVCTSGAKRCPDGSFVGRDPANSCRWHECPAKGTKPTEGATKPTEGATKPYVCTSDVKTCPDGTYVERDPTLQCRFKPCATKPTAVCCKAMTAQCLACSQDMTVDEYCQEHPRTVGCQPQNLKPTEGATKPYVCTSDVKTCPDGTYVGRDPTLQCRFKPCMKPTEGATKPTEGATKPTEGATKPYVCTSDVKTCPDGTYVERDPTLQCRFKPCMKPTEGATKPTEGATKPGTPPAGKPKPPSAGTPKPDAGGEKPAAAKATTATTWYIVGGAGGALAIAAAIIAIVVRRRRQQQQQQQQQPVTPKEDASPAMGPAEVVETMV